jgi:hypothetical protein
MIFFRSVTKREAQFGYGGGFGGGYGGGIGPGFGAGFGTNFNQQYGFGSQVPMT